LILVIDPVLPDTRIAAEYQGNNVAGARLVVLFKTVGQMSNSPLFRRLKNVG
jgi:hypothetical protein